MIAKGESPRSVKKQAVAADELVTADDLKRHDVATACERWHMGDPLSALATTLDTNAKQLALAFLLAGFTPDRVGIGQRSGRWGKTQADSQPTQLPDDSPFRYDARPNRAMTPHTLFGEAITPFNKDSLATKVDDLHRCALPLEYIRALTGASEAMVRSRAATLKRQGVRHALRTLGELDHDPLNIEAAAAATTRPAAVPPPATKAIKTHAPRLRLY